MVLRNGQKMHGLFLWQKEDDQRRVPNVLEPLRTKHFWRAIQGVTLSTTSCSSSWRTTRSWHSLARIGTVVPEPLMRVTLWALMGVGDDCDKRTQDATHFSICWFFSRVASNLDETSGNPSASFFACVPHGFALVCAVKQYLSFPFRPVTRSPSIAAMVWASFPGV